MLVGELGGHGQAYSSRLLARMVFRLDDGLRRHHRVFEYSADPKCIFRAQVRRLERRIALCGGSVFEAGQRIIEIHIWNEQVPLLHSSTLLWARQMHRALAFSLAELRRFLDADRSFDDIAAIRANLSFGTANETAQLLRISGRFGFEQVDDKALPSPLARLHRFGENILISMMVAARNREALRWDSLLRARAPVVLPRRVLAERVAPSLPEQEGTNGAYGRRRP